MGLFNRATTRSHRRVGSSPAPDGVDPICPYCDRPVTGVYWREIDMFGKTWLFFCVECSKVLGTAQRKTVPMG